MKTAPNIELTSEKMEWLVFHEANLHGGLLPAPVGVLIWLGQHPGIECKTPFVTRWGLLKWINEYGKPIITATCKDGTFLDIDSSGTIIASVANPDQDPITYTIIYKKPYVPPKKIEVQL